VGARAFLAGQRRGLVLMASWRCAGDLAITAAIEVFVSGPLKGELALMLMRER
jgi:hypothetical protein